MSLIDYHKATTRELLALTNNVRSLISHAPEDGRYKEAVLKNVIKRFIPQKYSIATGFVIKQTGVRGQHIDSNQIDLIIYDDASPVIFKEGDFVILTPDAVRGIIEVKANLYNQGIADVISQANVNGQFIFSGKEDKEQEFFNGVFSFEGYENNFNQGILINNYKRSNTPFINDPDHKKFIVNHVSLNKDLFIKLWADEPMPHSFYRIVDLSFSFFISNLIDTLANKSVANNNFIWFAADKEEHIITPFAMQ